MHKSVFIFDEIKDPVAFEGFIREDVIGFLIRVNGFVKLQLTYVNTIYSTTPKHLTGIQMILECYFTSIDHFKALFTFPEGIAFVEKIKQNPFCKVGSYIGQEYNLSPKHT